MPWLRSVPSQSLTANIIHKANDRSSPIPKGKGVGTTEASVLLHFGSCVSCTRVEDLAPKQHCGEAAEPERRILGYRECDYKGISGILVLSTFFASLFQSE